LGVYKMRNEIKKLLGIKITKKKKKSLNK